MNRCLIPGSSYEMSGIRRRVGAVEEARGNQPGPAVPGPDDVHRWLLTRLDHAVQVGVQEVEARRCAPVANQARLHMVARKRLPQQRVVEQVDLADAEVVGRSPPLVDLRDFGVAHAFDRRLCPRGGGHGVLLLVLAGSTLGAQSKPHRGEGHGDTNCSLASGIRCRRKRKPAPAASCGWGRLSAQTTSASSRGTCRSPLRCRR